jgi:hypothetical protein
MRVLDIIIGLLGLGLILQFVGFGSNVGNVWGVFTTLVLLVGIRVGITMFRRQ